MIFHQWWLRKETGKNFMFLPKIVIGFAKAGASKRGKAR
jgi:hypothetical protein